MVKKVWKCDEYFKGYYRNFKVVVGNLLQLQLFRGIFTLHPPEAESLIKLLISEHHLKTRLLKQARKSEK